MNLRIGSVLLMGLLLCIGCVDQAWSAETVCGPSHAAVQELEARLGALSYERCKTNQTCREEQWHHAVSLARQFPDSWYIWDILFDLSFTAPRKERSNFFAQHPIVRDQGPLAWYKGIKAAYRPSVKAREAAALLEQHPEFAPARLELAKNIYYYSQLRLTDKYRSWEKHAAEYYKLCSQNSLKLLTTFSRWGGDTAFWGSLGFLPRKGESALDVALRVREREPLEGRVAVRWMNRLWLLYQRVLRHIPTLEQDMVWLVEQTQKHHKPSLAVLDLLVDGYRFQENETKALEIEARIDEFYPGIGLDYSNSSITRRIKKLSQRFPRGWSPSAQEELALRAYLAEWQLLFVKYNYLWFYHGLSNTSQLFAVVRELLPTFSDEELVYWANQYELLWQNMKNQAGFALYKDLGQPPLFFFAKECVRRYQGAFEELCPVSVEGVIQDTKAFLEEAWADPSLNQYRDGYPIFFESTFPEAQVVARFELATFSADVAAQQLPEKLGFNVYTRYITARSTLTDMLGRPAPTQKPVWKRLPTPIALPDFELSEMRTGKTWSAESFSEGVFLIYIWQVSCPRCAVLSPLFAETALPEGIDFVSINIDPDPHAVQKYADEVGIYFPMLMHGGSLSKQLAEISEGAILPGTPVRLFVKDGDIIAALVQFPERTQEHLLKQLNMFSDTLSH